MRHQVARRGPPPQHAQRLHDERGLEEVVVLGHNGVMVRPAAPRRIAAHEKVPFVGQKRSDGVEAAGVVQPAWPTQDALGRFDTVQLLLHRRRRRRPVRCITSPSSSYTAQLLHRPLYRRLRLVRCCLHNAAWRRRRRRPHLHGQCKLAPEQR